LVIKQFSFATPLSAREEAQDQIPQLLFNLEVNDKSHSLSQ
jgi:hypothetical protein